MNPEIIKILKEGTPSQKRALFAFDTKTKSDRIRFKFVIWARWFFPEFFPSKDAIFHQAMDLGNINVYLGNETSFLNIGFRNSSKTTRTKLFVAFCIANDESRFRKYIKVLSKDSDNSKQFVTDVYNRLVSPLIKELYPELFEKTVTKREETMSSFTTATNIKVTSDSVGTDQRGDIQDAYRPDFVIYEDIETRKSLMSATITHSIWLNMEEARNGLAKGGGSLYLANYISERGNVHKLVQAIPNKLITPIAESRGGKWEPTWPERYSPEEVKTIENECRRTPDGDFEGEYLCKPSASKDVYFDRERVERQVPKEPIEVIAGLKIFRKYDPSHRIGSGHDVGGGVGLDSSTSVFIDYDAFPMQVIATYRNNEIRPDVFAHEIKRQCDRFGQNYCGVEKNYGSTIDILKTIYPTDKIHQTQRSDQKIEFVNAKEYGFETNNATKPSILIALSKAVENGHIELNDPDLIAEAKSYTIGDLMDKEIDPRLATRHFDLLIACAIALYLNPFVKLTQVERMFSNDVYNNFVGGKKEQGNPAL